MTGTLAISTLLLLPLAVIVVFALRAAGRERWHVAGIWGGALMVLAVPLWSVVTHAFLAGWAIGCAGGMLLAGSLVAWDRKKRERGDA